MPSTYDNLIYRELSYKIIGILFSVQNELGFGHREKYYQQAIANALKYAGLKFKEQLKVPLKYHDTQIGFYFLDFLIDDKIILEIKQGDYFAKTFYRQVHGYLKASDLKLAILANFSAHGVKFRRIVNIK